MQVAIQDEEASTRLKISQNAALQVIEDFLSLSPWSTLFGSKHEAHKNGDRETLGQRYSKEYENKN